MHLRFPVPGVPPIIFIFSFIFIHIACGPGKDTSESATGEDDATGAATTGGSTGAATTGEAPTTTGVTDATTGTGTGTTGEGGQRVLCDGEPANKPGCIDVCVRDVDPATLLVDPGCKVIETRADMSSVELAVCVVVNEAWAPPAGEEACYALLTDKSGSQTPSPLDDMDNDCVSDGHNAQISLFRSVPAMEGACAVVTCEPSLDVMRDCPNL